MTLIGLLVTLVLFCVIAWACRALLAAFGIGDPIATVVWVVLVLLFVYWLLQALGLSVGHLGTLRIT
jgi:hypothetical protein